MELSNLLDLLHYYFEEDTIPLNADQGEAKSRLRESMYPLLYDVEYEYSVKTDPVHTGNSPYAPPEEGQVAPYIPPTSPEELQAMLGPAMGE